MARGRARRARLRANYRTCRRFGGDSSVLLVFYAVKTAYSTFRIFIPLVPPLS